jgi:hypothetical protein
MRILIQHPHRPFSHVPGASCLVPHTCWKLIAYPARLVFENLSDGQLVDLCLDIQGPVKDFTVQQNLEKGNVVIFGMSKKGFFRLAVRQDSKGVSLQFEKLPGQQLKISHGIDSFVAGEKQQFSIGSALIPTSMQSSEKIFLGCSKEQDFDMIRRRCDLSEILPLWMRLGQLTPLSSCSQEPSGVFSLLDSCKTKIVSKQKNEITPILKEVFLAGFHGILCPRSSDDDHQGIICQTSSSGQSPLYLLSEGARLIRSLFFQESSHALSFIPCLPSEFVCGRFVSIKTASADLIDFIWSKKTMKMIKIQPGVSRCVLLEFPADIARFRLRKSLLDKGLSLNVGDEVHLQENQVVFIDRFEK